MIKAKNLKIKFGLILATLLTLGLSFNNNVSSIFNVEEAVVNSGGYEGYESHSYTDSKRADVSTLVDDHGDHNDFTEISTETNITTLSNTSYYLKESITITSQFQVSGSDVTLCLNGYSITVSSGFNIRLFNVAAGNTFRICDCGDNGEIKGGNLTNNLNGGAIYLNSNAKLYLEGGAITGNTASGNGGAIHLASGATFEMSGGTISLNSASGNGGAINGADSSTITISGGTISNNTATSYGGAIHITGSSSSLTMSGGEITRNIASNSGSGYGGAIAARGSSKVYIDGGTISNNVASTVESTTGYGGGIFIGQEGTLQMSGGTISENIANNTNVEESSGVGGGIYLNTSSEFTMNGGYITSNYLVGGSAASTSASGSGVLVQGSVFYMNGGQISDNKLYNSASLDTSKSLTLNSGQTGLTFDMTDGYLSGGVTINTNENVTVSIGVSGGYLGESANTDLADNVSDDSISVYIGDSDKQESFDKDYRSGFPYAIYKDGGTTTYTVTVDGDVCVDTDFADYIKFNGEAFGDSVSYTYNNGTEGLPTTLGTHTVSYTVEYLDSSSVPKVYHLNSGTFDIEIKDHQLTTDLESDEEYHWYVCQNTVCDNKEQEKEAHTYSLWTEVDDSSTEETSTCDVCGYETIRTITSTSNWLWILIIILVILVLINVIIAFIFIVRRRRKKRKELEELLNQMGQGNGSSTIEIK